MYNTDNILARLQKGEKLEDIGNELAAVLNAAQEQYTAIQKAEAEKQKAIAQKDKCRREVLREMLELLRKYAGYTDYADIANTWTLKITDEDIKELDAQVLELLKSLDMLAQLNFGFNIKPAVAVQEDTKKVAAVDPNKALGDFLKMMGW